MSLKLNSFENSGGNSPMPGVYINEVSVKSITIVDNPFPDSGYPKPDLAIEVEFDIGKDFFPKDIIAGNFKRDTVSGEVTGFGSAFKVADFFTKTLDNKELELNEDNTIPQEWLKKTIGTKVLRLTYAYALGDEGKSKYKHWNRYGDISKSSDILFKGFTSALEKGYIKDFYTPIPETPSNMKNMFPEESGSENKPLLI